MKFILVSVVLFNLIPSHLVHGEWCNKTETRTEMRTKTFTVTKYHQRRNFICRFWFNRNKDKCKIPYEEQVQESVPTEVIEEIPQCCSGYLKQEDPLRCDPICEPECINGLCVAPNRCQCLENFMRWKGELMEHMCHECDCPNGFCSLEKCSCNEGFIESLESGYCEPIELTPIESSTTEETTTENQVSTEWDSTSQISTDATEGFDSSSTTTTITTTLDDILSDFDTSGDSTTEIVTDADFELVEMVTNKIKISEVLMEMKESKRISINTWLFIILAIISCLLVSILVTMFVIKRNRDQSYKFGEGQEDSVQYSHQCEELSTF